MWKNFVDRILLAMMPHLSCLLIKIAKHLRKRYDVCELCDSCFCFVEGGDDCAQED